MIGHVDVVVVRTKEKEEGKKGPLLNNIVSFFACAPEYIHDM